MVMLGTPEISAVMVTMMMEDWSNQAYVGQDSWYEMIGLYATESN